MTARGFFYDASGNVRAPWRLATFIIACVLAYAVLEALLYPLIAGAASLAGARFAIYPWLTLGATLLAHRFVFSTVERRRWEMVALDRSALRPGAMATGALLGALAVGVPSLVLLALGWLRALPGEPGSSLGAAARIAIVLAPAAFAEELLLRGYIFAVLREKWGAVATLLATSATFGLIHLSNQGATAQSVAVVAVAGVFLGMVLLVTGSLYAAFTAHLAWNWVLAGLLHTPVSGIPFATPDYRIVDAGPDWATGGVWGPEGGAAAVLGMGAVMTYLYLRRDRREES